jgi:alpha-1,3-rhamnosyltransferase
LNFKEKVHGRKGAAFSLRRSLVLSDTDKPLVSVIVPSFNHEKFILNCLNSIKDQTYHNLELVIIDDGSSDRSPEIIERFIQKHEARFIRVHFESRPNRGVSGTLNECILHSKGEWIHPLASDDMFCPHKVESLLSAYLKWEVPEIALIYGDTYFIDDSGNLLDKTPVDRPPSGPNPSGYMELFLANRLSGPSMAFRRQAILDIGGYDESLAMEDWDCWLRLSARYPIARVPEIVSYYRYHGGNSHRRQGLMLGSMLMTFGKFLDNERGLLTEDVIRKNWRKNLHRLSRWARRSDKSLLPQVMLKALKAPFSSPSPSDYFYFAERVHRKLGV